MKVNTAFRDRRDTAKIMGTLPSTKKNDEMWDLEGRSDARPPQTDQRSFDS